jgi:hypothetical protein
LRIPAALKGVNGAIGTVIALVGLLITIGLIKPFGGESSADALASAATNLKEANSVAYVTSISARGPGVPPTVLWAKGAMNLIDRRGWVTADYSHARVLAHFSELRVVWDGPIAYFRTKPSAQRRRPWVRVDWLKASRRAGDRVSRRIASGLGRTEPLDTSDVLGEFAKEVKNLQDVGHERIRGLPVTHYRGSVASRRLIRILGGNERTWASQFGARFTYDIWVDSENLLRRLRVSAAKRFSVAQDTTYYDYGQRVKARIPAASSVRRLHDYRKFSDLPGGF